jgi:hypothetical protein
MAQPYSVKGIGEVMQVLNGISPELAKEARKDFKTGARPIVNAIRSSFPEVALSRWQPPKQTAAPGTVERTGAARLPAYKASEVRRKTNVSVQNRRVRGTGERTLLIKIRSSAPAVDALDMGGKVSNSHFTRNMIAKHGKPSRFIWPTVEKYEPQIRKTVLVAKESMERTINAQLRSRYSGKRYRSARISATGR